MKDATPLTPPSEWAELHFQTNKYNPWSLRTKNNITQWLSTGRHFTVATQPLNISCRKLNLTEKMEYLRVKKILNFIGSLCRIACCMCVHGSVLIEASEKSRIEWMAVLLNCQTGLPTTNNTKYIDVTIAFSSKRSFCIRVCQDNYWKWRQNGCTH